VKISPCAIVSIVLVGCATHRPVVVDVRCPRNTTMITAGDADGHCIAPDGKNHGPSWTASDKGVRVDGYDHGVRAGPFEHYDATGKLVRHGYRRGVTDSTEPSTEIGEAPYDSPKTSGRLVWPERVRLYPVQGDVAFTASTLVSAQGKPSSSFLGASIEIGFPARERMRYRGDAYRAYYVSYGVQGAAGVVARAECDDPTITGSGGFCGSRWMAGAYIRVGYARSHDATANSSVPSFLGYGRLGFLVGQDQWQSTLSTSSALVWRFRAGAGYTALGSLFSLVHGAHAASDSWRWLLAPFVFVLEHAEGYVELGGDGTSALGVGAGVDVGFGL
jgi:hypothetical protein